MPHQPVQTPSVERPLDGVLVIALEQAVAAPYCSSRLADAGARVIKIERREGDFPRGYDRTVHGESSYFVWINRGKESIALDVKNPDDKALLDSMWRGPTCSSRTSRPEQPNGWGSARPRCALATRVWSTATSAATATMGACST